MSKKYRTKIGAETGSVVDAIQFNGDFDELEKFVGGDAGSVGDHWVVAAPHGALHLDRGDWVVRKAGGVFIACTPFIFGELYGPVKP